MKHIVDRDHADVLQQNAPSCSLSSIIAKLLVPLFFWETPSHYLEAWLSYRFLLAFNSFPYLPHLSFLNDKFRARNYSSDTVEFNKVIIYMLSFSL